MRASLFLSKSPFDPLLSRAGYPFVALQCSPSSSSLVIATTVVFLGLMRICLDVDLPYRSRLKLKDLHCSYAHVTAGSAFCAVEIDHLVIVCWSNWPPVEEQPKMSLVTYSHDPELSEGRHWQFGVALPANLQDRYQS